MKVLIEVELTRIIGKSKSTQAIAKSVIEKMPKINEGIEVDESGYVILGVTHKE